MHQNKFWLSFLALLTLALLWFSYGCFKKITHYNQHNLELPLAEAQWTVKKIAADHYTLQVKYAYLADSKKFHTTHTFEKPIYQNPWAAEQIKKQRIAHPPKLWIRQNHPDQSTLEKKFPLKEAVSAVILWGLWLYFLWLGFYVTKFTKGYGNDRNCS